MNAPTPRPLAVVVDHLPPDVRALLPVNVRPTPDRVVTSVHELPGRPFDLRGADYVLATAVTGAGPVHDLLRASARGVHLILDVGSPVDTEPDRAGRLGDLLDQLDRIADVRLPGARLTAEIAAAAPARPGPELDDDQVALLRELARGRSVTEAGAHLALSRRTAYRRVGELVELLGASSPLDAARRAGASGLLDPGPDRRPRSHPRAVSRR